MKLAARTLTALGRIVTGDEMISRYRSGPDLVRLFNDYGSDDIYGQGFPSRWQYAEEKLRALNATEALGALICEVLDPREFMGCDKEPEPAIDYLNKRLSYDGYVVILEGGFAKIRNLKGVQVKAIHPFEGSTEHAHLFIDEQIKKSEKKIQEEDYDGAITNARSLLEAVLREVEDKLDSDAPRYDGDLPKLYKRVQKLLNLDPGRPEIDQPLKQVLSGLVNIIQGLSGLSNKMGDRHARSYRPSRHHALLICNAAKTVSNFIFDTYSYQQAKKQC